MNITVWSNCVTCRLFVDSSKVTPQVKAHLKVDQCPNEKLLCVLLKPYEAITEEVKILTNQKRARILVSTTTARLGSLLRHLRHPAALSTTPISYRGRRGGLRSIFKYLFFFYLHVVSCAKIAFSCQFWLSNVLPELTSEIICITWCCLIFLCLSTQASTSSSHGIRMNIPKVRF